MTPPDAPLVLASPWARFGSHVLRELIFLSWLGMEVALLAPLCFVFLPWLQLWPPGLLALCLLLLMILPFNLVRLLSALHLQKERQRRIMALALLVTVLLAWRSLLYRPAGLLDVAWLGQLFGNLAQIEDLVWLRDVSLFLLVVFAWWRGLRLIDRSSGRFVVADVGLRLRVGGLLVAPFVLWTGGDRVLWNMTPFVLLFFLVGLTAVALVRAEEIEQSQSGQSVALTGGWVTAVFLAALFVVFSAALLALFISGDPANILTGWLAPLWLALYFGGVVIGRTLFHLAVPLFQLLGFFVEWLTRLLTPLLSQFSQSPPTPTPAIGLAAEATRAANEAPATGVGLQLVTILLMVAVILVVTLALGRLYRQAELAQRETETAVANRLPAPPEGLGRKLLHRLGLLRGWRTAVTIRRIYQNMSRAAGGAGYPRAAAETPYEYLTTLTTAWPDNVAETTLITQAYVKIRYGELPESPAELAEIQAAWKRLERVQPTAVTPSTPTLT